MATGELGAKPSPVVNSRQAPARRERSQELLEVVLRRARVGREQAEGERAVGDPVQHLVEGAVDVVTAGLT